MVGAELEAKRSRLRAEHADRARADREAKRALRDVNVPPATTYTLHEVVALAGAEPFELAARDMIDRHNVEVWGMRRRDGDRAPLVSAAELHKLGMPVEMIAKLASATGLGRAQAGRQLAVAREQFRLDTLRRAKMGDQPQASLADDVLTIDHLLCAGTLSELVGDPGSGKSFVALDAACSIALGRHFAADPASPRTGKRTEVQGPGIYVAGEGGAGQPDRVAAWCRYRGIDPAQLQASFYLVRRAVQLGDVTDMAELTAIAKNIGAVLVVIDTRARSSAGLGENEASDQGLAIKNIDTLIAATSAAVLTVHHTARGTNHGRGSTAWFGAVQTSLRIERWTTSKLTIVCDKQKDVEDGCKHQFELVGVPASDARKSSLALRALDAFEEADQINETGDAVVEIVRDLQTIEASPPRRSRRLRSPVACTRRSPPNTAITSNNC